MWCVAVCMRNGGGVPVQRRVPRVGSFQVRDSAGEYLARGGGAGISGHHWHRRWDAPASRFVLRGAASWLPIAPVGTGINLASFTWTPRAATSRTSLGIICAAVVFSHSPFMQVARHPDGRCHVDITRIHSNWYHRISLSLWTQFGIISTGTTNADTIVIIWHHLRGPGVILSSAHVARQVARHAATRPRHH